MSENKKIILKIAEQLEREEKEIQLDSEMAEEIIPLLDELDKREIVDAVRLRLKIFRLLKESKHEKHQDAIYGLFRISVGAAPTGSFLILDPRKALAFLNSKIIGLTKRVVSAIKKTPHYILNPLCDIVNNVNIDKLNQPSKDLVQNRQGSEKVNINDQRQR